MLNWDPDRNQRTAFSNNIYDRGKFQTFVPTDVFNSTASPQTAALPCDRAV